MAVTKKIGSARKMLTIECGTIVPNGIEGQHLPLTINDSRIRSNHAVVAYNLTDVGAVVGSWVVSTSNGSLTITGTCGISTNATLFLLET